MNKRLSLKIARRMNTLLTQALGEGVEAPRMLADRLYARDVLLVCDAMEDPELRKLARMFRQAQLEADDSGRTPLQREPLSISSMLNSIFGALGDPVPPAPPASPQAAEVSTPAPDAATGAPSGLRRWFGLGRPVAGAEQHPGPHGR